MAVLPLNSLPLGFRFRPTDVELIDFYLRMKIDGNHDQVRIIREIDICKWEPWDLPDLSVIKAKDSQWFFFCPRDRKYPNGQRLNRATSAGYWKATGKDRRIMSGTRLIGMKKTLVFHTGRAPKGQNTNWVIHEYRATEKDLDGSNPGQGAFVLCRLFNKQVKNVEGSSCDDVELPVSSPITAKSSSEDLQSELELPHVSPVLEREDKKHPTDVECCPVDLSNRNSDDKDNQVGEVTATEVDTQLEEDLSLFYVPELEPLDYSLFSPLHSQMQAELGSCIYFPATNDLSNSHPGVQFQYGTNESDECFFVNSILESSDEHDGDESGSQKNSIIENETTKSKAFVKDSGSCIKSDAEVAQTLQHEPELPCSLRPGENVDRKAPLEMETALKEHEASNHMYAMGRGDVGTGIRIRPRKRQIEPVIKESAMQGTASRRLQLQCKLSILPLHCSKELGGSGWLPEEHESQAIVTEEANAAENDTTGVDTATGVTNEAQKIYLPPSSENSKFSLELTRNNILNLSSKGYVPMGEAVPARSSMWSFAVMYMIIMVSILFMILVSSWSVNFVAA